MLFSSISFLYYFLPCVLIIYFCSPKKIKNLVLLLSSLLFYFYGEPVYIFVMIGSIVSAYIHGILMNKYPKHKKKILVSATLISLGLLGLFKYSNFIISNINSMLNADITLIKIALPIGISFYTFQILSYVIDVYNGKVEVQKSFIKLATYVSLFPQLIAGPIVRYIDIEKEINERKHSFENFALGTRRFVIGLAKKILIANQLGELCKIFLQSNDLSVISYWTYGAAFMLQIYFDFSAYSDMAIGLRKNIRIQFFRKL